MKKLFLGIVLVLLLVACAPKETPQEQPAAMEEKTGRAVFTITDAAANMSAVTSVKVTVDSVKVHSSTEGWVTVSSQPKTYDLLKLKTEGSQELLADVQLKEGTYQQVRLDVSKVVVTDASGEHEAKLPSGELKIVGELVVKANSTSTATFDFIADESLHITGKGEYILAPVVKLETQEDAEVEVDAESKVKINKGRVKTSVKVGMDAEGNVGIGLEIKRGLNLSIEGTKIKLGPLVSAEAKARAEEKQEAQANASANASAKGKAKAEAEVNVSLT